MVCQEQSASIRGIGWLFQENKSGVLYDDPERFRSVDMDSGGAP
jgi:hypothetical protein